MAKKSTPTLMRSPAAKEKHPDDRPANPAEAPEVMEHLLDILSQLQTTEHYIQSRE